MTLDLWFWVIFIVSLLFGFYVEYATPLPWYRGARHFIIYVLIFILGLKVFGGPVK